MLTQNCSEKKANKATKINKIYYLRRKGIAENLMLEARFMLKEIRSGSV